jgi:phosphate acyltransferase
LELNFIGYVEGFDLFQDAVDVVVADGFTGNVVLKTAESLGSAMMHLLRNELTVSPLRRLGALLSRGALRSLKERLDPELYGGAVLLGMNGNVIKAHGSSRERAMMHAIRVASEEIKHGVNQMISRQIARANQLLAVAEGQVSPSVPA